MESKDSKTPKDEEKDNEKEKYQIEIIGEQYKEYDFTTQKVKAYRNNHKIP